MVELAGFKCRERACRYGAEGKAGCNGCDYFTELLLTYQLEPKTSGMKCATHVHQDNKNCVICATYSAIREVNLKEAITVEEHRLHRRISLSH